ncbi:resolvase family protein [Glycocaulis alkaliphilus]|uniref:Resolvase family protein n=1 Tax=Glycocaulis alkaliphilus TaxID=1434191 RepID=A0A3T0E7E8_9PROT|nr:recombinase family protein [Glycocaulis alkaliphilus]AZU03252.1 resolvase family protein [Glycocaulis alkaliphilus]
MLQFVIYRRVSTEEQGRSGLGLEAQDRDIALFLETYAETPFEVIGEFTDVLSGKGDDRPQLQAALDLVRSRGATLLVAKLDRLSRKVSFIASIMDDKRVNLRVASMPYADKFSLHIYAALAEQEREFISLRTKQALAAAKARGVKLGGDRGNIAQINAAKRAKADAFAETVEGIVKPLKERGATLREIAEALNAAGVQTRGGGRWHPNTVSRVVARLEAA